MTKPMLAIASLAALLLLGAAGCVHHVYHDDGPSPHAAAHGQRYHHGDVDLVWDTHLGVYAVVGFPAVYFWGDHYYRFHDGGWQWGPRPRGDWKRYRGHVPPGLAKKHPGKHGKFKRSGQRYR